MNLHTDTMPDSALPLTEPAFIPATRQLYWSLRRELWENRYLYVAPAAAAVLVLFGFSIHPLVHGGLAQLAAASQPSPTVLSPDQQHAITQPYEMAGLVLMAVTFLVAIFYSLDALYGERRDRSILFWKSLPVSDLTTVLTKASIPILFLPLLSFVLTVIVQVAMLSFTALALAARGYSLHALRDHLPLFQLSISLLYHLVFIHGLWFAPFYAWFLLVSSWARRMPILWAILPPLALGLVERLAFNTHYLQNLLVNRISGGSEGSAYTAGSMSMDPTSMLHPIQLLTSPGLWTGLILTAIFLATATHNRRNRGPI